MPYPGDLTVKPQQGWLNSPWKGGVQAIHGHVKPPLVPCLPWENAKVYVRLQPLSTRLLISVEKGGDLFQVRLCDSNDDLPPCPQVNFGSQSFERFLLQDFGQLNACPTSVGMFVGTEDISPVQGLRVFLAGGFD